MSKTGVAGHYGPRGLVHGGDLTETQQEIERLSIEGVPHREIARRLSVSFWMVRRELDKIRDVRAFERMQRANGR